MKGFAEYALKAVEEYTDEANLDKPKQVSCFFFYRALGHKNTEIAESIGVDRTTLNNWDNKLNEKLEPHEYNDLVVNACAYEHAKRQSDNNE